MPTLVVTLNDGKEKRIPNVARATEERNDVVAYDDSERTMARFKLEDLRSWYLEE